MVHSKALKKDEVMKRTSRVFFFSAVLASFLALPSAVSADYPPIPIELGKRVDAPVAPVRLADAAAVALKPESIAVVVDPKPSVRRITLRAVDQSTGRVVSKVVTISNASSTITPALALPAGTYRVQVVGELRNGTTLRWPAGTHTVPKKRR